VDQEHPEDGYRPQAVEERKARMPWRRGDRVGNVRVLGTGDPEKAGIVRLRRRVGYLHEANRR
jgi:hypothetical protein